MSWALIAGGSKGIGFSIAEALANRQYNLILIARNQTDLLVAKNRLENGKNIRVEILVCDLALAESASEISNWCLLNKFEVTVLCNAAGMGGSKDFLSLPLTDLKTMIHINFESVMALTLVLLPILQKNAPSYILNIGSMAGFTPIPIKNIYSASKSALHFFSYSLHYQLKKINISVSCLCPGPVFTKPSIEQETKNKLGWFGNRMAMKPDVVGERAVQGMLKHKMIIVPGKLASVVALFLRAIPTWLTIHIYFSFGKQGINS